MLNICPTYSHPSKARPVCKLSAIKFSFLWRVTWIGPIRRFYFNTFWQCSFCWMGLDSIKVRCIRNNTQSDKDCFWEFSNLMLQNKTWPEQASAILYHFRSNFYHSGYYDHDGLTLELGEESPTCTHSILLYIP